MPQNSSRCNQYPVPPIRLALPGVDADPTTALHGEGAHVHTVFGFDEAGLLVGVADAREVGAYDLELRIEAGVVGRHLEHPEVEEGDRGEGAAGDQDKRGAVGRSETSSEARVREGVSVERHLGSVGGGHDGGGWGRGWRVDGEEVRKADGSGASGRPVVVSIMRKSKRRRWSACGCGTGCRWTSTERGRPRRQRVQREPGGGPVSDWVKRRHGDGGRNGHATAVWSRRRIGRNEKSYGNLTQIPILGADDVDAIGFVMDEDASRLSTSGRPSSICRCCHVGSW
ncbi:hypothetical protein KC365_g14 [Hortaea werneckii]|nr:hypothetical protein KC339_g13 [Hortaea werneckii]KAI7245934.1 hypothetical protein KC365_g14 [Hortaea werneckii]